MIEPTAPEPLDTGDTPLPLDLPAPDLPAAEPAPGGTSDWPNWQYHGPDGRIYTNIPWTSVNGGIITWPDLPATDGCWTITTNPPTCMPDSRNIDYEPGFGLAATTAPAETTTEE